MGEREKSDKIKNMYEVSWLCVAVSTLWLTYFCQFVSLSGKLLPVLQCILLSLPLSHSFNTVLYTGFNTNQELQHSALVHRFPAC